MQSLPQTGGLKEDETIFQSKQIKAMGLKKKKHFIMNNSIFMLETDNALLTIQWTMKRPTQEVMQLRKLNTLLLIVF